MKSNIHKLGQKVLKLLKNHNKILIIPTSHNALNQIDVALKRIGIHGDPKWTPRLARNTGTETSYEKREYKSDINKRTQLLADFSNNLQSGWQATVAVIKTDDKYIAQVHNHDCDVPTNAHIIFKG